MEYCLKNGIAAVTAPPQLTLSRNPAFAEFRKPDTPVPQPSYCTLTVRRYNEGDEMPLFKITELKSRQSYCIGGVTDRNEANDSSFFVDVSSPEPEVWLRISATA
jgi:hypothetical protein